MQVSDIRQMGIRARQAALSLATAGINARNEALGRMAQALRDEQEAILRANEKDVQAAQQGTTPAAMIDRLRLSPERIEQMAAGLEQIASLPDPLGMSDHAWTRPNGLKIERVRVPLGVIGIIYESRPNVTADAAGLCLKSGNACMLRGGSDALTSNIAIAAVLRQALSQAGLSQDAIQLLEDPSREMAREMMRLNGYIDVLIPRGGAGLIRSVVENASVPVIETGAGVCHTYVDGECRDLDMAMAVVRNAKCSRPSVCNAMETLLVDQEIEREFLPRCLAMLAEQGVQIRGCERTRKIYPQALPAQESDWDTEYNDMILSVRVVDGLEAAIEHINCHSTRHSECILTHDVNRALRFTRAVDAAAVYVNASTRFTDGGEFGFGAEIGISNQKLHARGPMGLSELTTYKYVIMGQGQVR